MILIQNAILLQTATPVQTITSIHRGQCAACIAKIKNISRIISRFDMGAQINVAEIIVRNMDLEDKQPEAVSTLAAA